LPGGEPFGDLLQPAERACRLGELGLAAHHLRPGFEIRSWQVAQDAAHFIKGGIHRGRGPSYSHSAMTSPNEPPPFQSYGSRPSSFDDWLQAFKEQASFFTGLKLDVGAPRWPLSEVLPVLPVIGAAVGLAAGLVFAIVRGLGPGWLAAVLAV